MSKYKIIISDLDGTLLNNQSKVSNENINAIKELSGKGIHFVPSSGRTLGETPKEVLNIPGIRYIIYSNGAVILDRKTGETFSECIPKTQAKFLLDTLNSYETLMTVRFNGEGYFDATRQSIEECKYHHVEELHRNVVAKTGIMSENFDELCYSFDNIEVISVFFHSDKELNECKKILEETGDYLIAEAFAHNLEVFSSKAGKGNGLKRLSALLDINLKDIISVGDSMNDATMIETAGLGLAVSNAADGIKKICNDVICSNEEHAVKYIKEHYFN